MYSFNYSANNNTIRSLQCIVISAASARTWKDRYLSYNKKSLNLRISWLTSLHLPLTNPKLMNKTK